MLSEYSLLAGYRLAVNSEIPQVTGPNGDRLVMVFEPIDGYVSQEYAREWAKQNNIVEMLTLKYISYNNTFYELSIPL